MPTPSLRKRRPQAVVIGVLIIALGLVFAYVFLSAHLAQFDAARNFRPAEATVLSSRMITSHRAITNNPRTYSVHVEYRYRVAGRDYTSARYAFLDNDRFTDPLYAKRVLAKYPSGATITIWHDPDDPARAVIDRRFPAAPWVLILLPVLFAGFGLAVLAWGMGWLPEKR